MGYRFEINIETTAEESSYSIKAEGLPVTVQGRERTLQAAADEIVNVVTRLGAIPGEQGGAGK